MALKKYIVDLLQDNPLNGISTDIDVLTLSTGTISRKIKKLVLTGDESYVYQSAYSRFYFTLSDAYYSGTTRTTPCICSHYQSIHDGRGINDVPNESIYISTADNRTAFNIKTTDHTTETDFKTYLSQQYANGTPVTIWYILAAATTEQITVPTGLSGTVDGYTTQTGTPTPTMPIYPTANTVTMWANYTPSRYNGIAFVTATGQPEQYNGGWS